MCGIVAYVGGRDCTSILVDGLRRLEYRGYDSAGVAVQTGRGIRVVRAVGKLSGLDLALRADPPRGVVGIGHTRWATHGRPTEINAHPHVAGQIAVVHNGIIENHAALRIELQGRGVRFSSDTDTEILAHLVNEARGNGARSLENAVRAALRRVRGAYAIAVVDGVSPGEIVVARQDSPLVLGVGDGEMVAASDVPALLAVTRDVVFLQDGDLAVLTKNETRIMTISEGQAVVRATQHIDWSPAQAEKGGYKHFMLKEIFEQPRAIEDTIRGRIDASGSQVVGEAIGLNASIAKKISRVCFVACGTSSHAATAGRYWIEQLARVPATMEVASEVRYRDPVFADTDLVVAVSQSGETLDTLAAIKAARAQGAHVLAVSNVLGSAIPRAADFALYTHAGPEIGVASTKCFTTQLAAMLLLAVYLGGERGTLPVDDRRRILGALSKVPQQMRVVLEQADNIKDIARKHARASNMLFLGRGTSFPVALEGALKVKELSYIHAEGYAAGEMKHGPIALIDAAMPVVVVCPKDAHYEKTLSNMQEVKARDAQLVAVCTVGDMDVAKLLTAEPRRRTGSWYPGRADAAPTAPDVMEVPEADAEVLPLLTVLPLQMLAYFTADLKGTDVDQPRNLAKTVTVE